MGNVSKRRLKMKPTAPKTVLFAEIVSANRMKILPTASLIVSLQNVRIIRAWAPTSATNPWIARLSVGMVSVMRCIEKHMSVAQPIAESSAETSAVISRRVKPLKIARQIALQVAVIKFVITQRKLSYPAQPIVP
jgi:hypothetical protein